MSAVSLKELLRKRVMEDMIKAVQPAAKWKLLVVDSNSAKLLTTICKSHEILQENVTGKTSSYIKLLRTCRRSASRFQTMKPSTLSRLLRGP
jgi:hypothetical protein